MAGHYLPRLFQAEVLLFRSEKPEERGSVAVATVTRTEGFAARNAGYSDEHGGGK